MRVGRWNFLLAVQLQAIGVGGEWEEKHVNSRVLFLQNLEKHMHANEHIRRIMNLHNSKTFPYFCEVLLSIVTHMVVALYPVWGGAWVGGYMVVLSGIILLCNRIWSAVVQNFHKRCVEVSGINGPLYECCLSWKCCWYSSDNPVETCTREFIPELPHIHTHVTVLFRNQRWFCHIL